LILAGPTNGTGPVVWHFGEIGAGGDTVIGISDCGVIDIPTDYTHMFFHQLTPTVV
jgi:hypothetical protein